MKFSKKVTDKVIRTMPIEKPFRSGDISDVLYPNSIRYDSDGRVVNGANSIVAQILRSIRGVQEKPYGIFFAHKEYFNGSN